MKTIIQLFVTALSLCLLASMALAEIKKEDFITLTFPKGVTLNVPRDWKIATHYDGKETTYKNLGEIAQEHASFDESILMEFEGRRNTVMLLKSMISSDPYFLPGQFTILYIGYFTPDPSDVVGPGQAEIESITNLEEFNDECLAQLQQSYASSADKVTLYDYSGLSKLGINRLIAIYFNYKFQFSTSNTPMAAQVFYFYNNEDSFVMSTVSIHEANTKAAPNIQRIINSLRIEK